MVGNNFLPNCKPKNQKNAVKQICGIHDIQLSERQQSISTLKSTHVELEPTMSFPKIWLGSEISKNKWRKIKPKQQKIEK